MAAQFFAWYPTTLAPVPAYTTPRTNSQQQQQQQRRPRHTRPRSVASSTPHTSSADLRISTSSTSTSATTISSGGIEPSSAATHHHHHHRSGLAFHLPRPPATQHLPRHHPPPPPPRRTRSNSEKQTEKQKLKKRRGQPAKHQPQPPQPPPSRNTRRHARSNSADSVVVAKPAREDSKPPLKPAPGPGGSHDDKAARAEQQQQQQAATRSRSSSHDGPPRPLFHRRSDLSARRGPRDAAVEANYQRIIGHLHDPCPHLLAHPALAKLTDDADKDAPVRPALATPPRSPTALSSEARPLDPIIPEHPPSPPQLDTRPAEESPAEPSPLRHRPTAPCCPSCCPSLQSQPPSAEHLPPSAPSSPRAPTQPFPGPHSPGSPSATLQTPIAPPHRPPSAPFRRPHQPPPRRGTSPAAAVADTILPFPTTGPSLAHHRRLPVAMYADTSAARLNALNSRSESLSSGSASLGARTMGSFDPSASSEAISTRPFAPRGGRTYLNDPTLVYPLPVDLAELHRQSLRTLLLIQVFGAPACSPAHAQRPPARVLEIGCGSGFWSMMCHRYFRDLGHPNISFTGLDIAPLAPGAGVASGGSGTPRDVAKPDPEMNWRFVRHDVRQTPFPFSDGEFDLVMVKDMSLAVTHSGQQRLMDEYLRVLKKGGHLELWESDHTIRMLRPHVAGGGAAAAASGASSSSSSAAAPEQEEEEHRAAAALGAYVMTSNTPLSPPLNNYLVEYDSWVSRALEMCDVSAVPCTLIGPLLLQESDALVDVRSRRLAIPLSDVRWEKEGVGGVVTKDGKSYIDTRGKGGKAGEGGAGAGGGKKLSAAQAALRRTALEVVVQGVQGLEPMLREVSGKRVDEWEGWISKMAGDLMGDGGTSWGECLEVGAWWAQKK